LQEREFEEAETEFATQGAGAMEEETLFVAECQPLLMVIEGAAMGNASLMN
jgi:hypothetical protein